MSDTLFNILAPAWAILGMVVLIFALFRDAFRQHLFPRLKKRRCPKCWYDMSHTEGRRCSECGHTANAEKKLYKSRLSTRASWATLVIFGLAYTCTALPRVMKRGWLGWVPTTALALMVPRLDFDEGIMGVYVQSGPPLLTKTWRGEDLEIGLPERFVAEWVDRAKADEINTVLWKVFIKTTSKQARREGYVLRHAHYSLDCWKPQMFALAESMGHLESADVLRELLTLPSCSIRTRTRWPVGIPLYAMVEPTEYFDGETVDATLVHQTANPEENRTATLVGKVGSPGCYNRPEQPWWYEEPTMQMIGVISAEEPVVQLQVEGRRRIGKKFRARLAGEKKMNWEDGISLPVEMVASIDDILQSVKSPAIDSVLATTLEPLLHESPGSTGEPMPHLHLNLEGLKRSALLQADLTLALHFEVLRDGAVVYTGSAWWDEPKTTLGYVFGSFANAGPVILVELRATAFQSVEMPRFKNQGQWSLRITGDPELALRNFNCDRYWQGSVTIPIAWRDPVGNDAN